MDVFCSHHQEFGECSKEDWDDAKSGRSPSRTVLVLFESFSQAIPICMLAKAEDVVTIDIKEVNKMIKRVNKRIKS